MFAKRSLPIILLICALWAGCGANEYRDIPAESEKMRYLLFPAAGSQELPRRAIIVNGRELHSRGAIEYYDGDTPVSIELSTLTLTPTYPIAGHIDELNREIRRWGESTDYAEVATHADGEYMTVTISYKNGDPTSFKYRITGELIVADTTMRMVL